MKRYLYFTFCFLSIISAEEKKISQQPTPPPIQTVNQSQNPPRDYGPEIVATFFSSIVPNFLKVALGAEIDDLELVYNGFAGLSQGVGTVIHFATRAPNNIKCLKASKAFLACLKKNKKIIKRYSHLKKQNKHTRSV